MKRLAVAVLVVLAAATGAAAQSRVPGGPAALRSDPPGFGAIPVRRGQTMRLNVACFPHKVGQFPPGPCKGELMFHDVDGMVVRSRSYDLRPGEMTSLDVSLADPPGELGAGDVALANDVLLVPCIVPAPGSGFAVPTVEAIERATRHVALFANPAAAQMSDVSNGRGNPGARVGFNPQPDPPGFGAITLATDQVAQMHVTCFAHQVGQFPPDPCRGSVMFHAADGSVLTSGRYALMPGESMTFEFAPMATDVVSNLGIAPCIEPDPGGRAVPSVSVRDAATGRTSMFSGPAVPAMSDFAR
jgi:hypothetical protein